jgi:fucose permease
MTAGVPGSGIGGFFYLLSAILMPVKESVSIWQKKSSSASRRTVLRQAINAVGVMAGVWLTGWFIAQAVGMVRSSMHIKGQDVVSIARGLTLVYGLITLLSVFLFVQVLSATLRKLHPHGKRPCKS